jgi:hypothetical protein
VAAVAFITGDGLRGHGADANQDQTVTVSELHWYVIDQVRKLTQGGQNPTVRRENPEYDFAVYERTRESKIKHNLETAR